MFWRSKKLTGKVDGKEVIFERIKQSYHYEGICFDMIMHDYAEVRP